MSLSLPPEILELDELLSPEDALEFFTSLVPSMELVPEFAELHRRRSFTMAHKADQAMLERVQNKIAEFIEQGKGRTEIVHDIEDILDAAGVTPANPQYSEMVFRTNTMDSFNEGITQELQDPEMREFFPVWQYLGIRDGRQGQDHEPHFDKFFSNDVPFAEVRDSLKAVSVNGETQVVPAGEGEARPFNCRCTQRMVSKWEWSDLQAGGARVEPWPVKHAEKFAEGSGKPCGESHISADKECRIGQREMFKPDAEQQKSIKDGRSFIQDIPIHSIDSKIGESPLQSKVDSFLRMMKKGNRGWPLVEVRRKGTRYEVVDGNHRMAAYALFGKNSIPVIIVEDEQKHKFFEHASQSALDRYLAKHPKAEWGNLPA